MEIVMIITENIIQVTVGNEGYCDYKLRRYYELLELAKSMLVHPYVIIVAFFSNPRILEYMLMSKYQA